MFLFKGLPSDVQQAYLSAVDGQGAPSYENFGPAAQEQSDSQSNNTESDSNNIGSENQPTPNIEWGNFVPSTPAPIAVECSVEVVTVSIFSLFYFQSEP
jgi:hypothetical protein